MAKGVRPSPSSSRTIIPIQRDLYSWTSCRGTVGEFRAGLWCWKRRDAGCATATGRTPDRRSSHGTVDIVIQCSKLRFETFEELDRVLNPGMARLTQPVRVPADHFATRRRPVTSSDRIWLSASASGRGSGRDRSPNSAMIRASSVSVLASCPVARAKSRIWRSRVVNRLY
jgi:hypothetical protein